MSLAQTPLTPAAIAEQFINNTNRNVFLTGKAGTGKTTFLKHIVSSTHKKVIITAPTGIAALNAGGVTLHSQFQLPLGGFIPDYRNFFADNFVKFETKATILRHLRMNDIKRQTIKEAELMIIDEVSMLRADILDAVDFMLQHIRRKRTAFGGLQVLFIGDLLQLPPVIKNEEWSILKDYYSSPFFFDAQVLKNDKPVYIELDKIYRQQDLYFTNILNNLRYNELTIDDAETLNKYYHPGFKPKPDEGYITLTTHNRFADEINQRELQKLDETSYQYDADVEGDYPDSMIPVEKRITLKTGAQVMFIKNDITGAGKFYNGKIGVIDELDDDKVVVKTDAGKIIVDRYEWENIRYHVDDNTRDIKEEKLGTYRQYPLRLAWAITIHKSQGLTFDKAILDVQNVFASGQAYVALSRLRSLDGLVLTKPFETKGIANSNDVLRFEDTKTEQGEPNMLLEHATIDYLRTFSTGIFDFTDLAKEWLDHIASYNKDDTQSEKQQHLEWAEQQFAQISALADTATKFRYQLIRFFTETQLNISLVAQRLTAAYGYFEPPLKEICSNVYLHRKKMLLTRGTKAYANELEDLDSALLNKLKNICKAMLMAQFSERAEFFTKEKWQQSFDMKWRIALTLTEVEAPVKKKKKEKGETYQTTYTLYQQGMSAEAIAEDRKLAIGTIHGHFARLIAKGLIEIDKVITTEKLQRVNSTMDENPNKTLGEIMILLNNEVSYGELRMVLAERERLSDLS